MERMRVASGRFKIRGLVDSRSIPVRDGQKIIYKVRLIYLVKLNADYTDALKLRNGSWKDMGFIPTNNLSGSETMSGIKNIISVTVKNMLKPGAREADDSEKKMKTK